VVFEPGDDPNTLSDTSVRPFKGGDRVSVRWTDQYFYPATIHGVEEDGRVNVTYDSGETELGIEIKLLRWLGTSVEMSMSPVLTHARSEQPEPKRARFQQCQIWSATHENRDADSECSEPNVNKCGSQAHMKRSFAIMPASANKRPRPGFTTSVNASTTRYKKKSTIFITPAKASHKANKLTQASITTICI